ncbi:MAG: hypothetical protein HPY44_20035 [Armatimonadetes bacterium]|nr:hypothetical protein [Armatimonadota bacterium]
MILDQYMDLAQCEEALASQLSGKTLLGEAPLEAEDVCKLGRLFCLMDSPATIWRRFPFCAACFTTGVFSHFYDDKYWPHFRDQYLQLSGAEETEWRDAFEGFLRRTGLPAFHHVDGQRFLRHVRIHALIPANGVGRLFEHVVRPAVMRGLDDGEWTAAEILRELGVSYPQLHRPEENFLNYGGHVADDLLGRCMTLYRRSVQGSVGDDSLDLPQWLVDAFREWIDGHPSHRIPLEGHAERPQIHLRLSLDSAAVTLVVAQLPSEWRSGRTMNVYAENGPDDSTLVAAQRVEVDPFVRQTESRLELPLETLASRYRVEWRKTDDECSTVEHVRGFLGNGVRWAAFAANDPENRLIRQQYLPRGEVWLVCPTDACVKAVQIDGGVVEPAQCPESFGLDGISGMSARLIDTMRCSGLVLEMSPADGKTAEEHIPVDLMPQLRLVGEVPGASIAGVPVCAEVPEVDCIGDNNGVVVEIELLDGMARPPLPAFVQASELRAVLQGRSGVFRFRVRGRLGRRGTPVTVALIPGLQVRFTPPIVLPGHNGHTVVDVSAPHCQVRRNPQSAHPGVSGHDPMVVSPDARRLNLQLVHLPPGGGARQFDLAVVVPRLLVGVTTPGGEPNLLPAVARIPKQSIENTPRVFLDLLMQPNPTRWNATLRADALQAAVTQPAGRQTSSARIRFDLAMWRDAILAANRAVELRVDAYRADLQIAEGTLVALISSECRLVNATAEFVLGGRGAILRYEFDPHGPAANLRLVSTSYPWLSPIEIQVPGRHRGEIELPNMAPGAYAIEPVGDPCSQADIIPDLDGMKCLDLLTHDEAQQHGWEALLRKTAQIWDGTWRQRGGQWELDEESADRADHDMSRYVREAQGTHPALRLKADDLRHTLVLMVYWGSQSVRCKQAMSAQYWERAVLLTVRLLRQCTHAPNLFGMLTDRLDELRQVACPRTREICRRLQGVLIRCFQRC